MPEKCGFLIMQTPISICSELLVSISESEIVEIG